MTYSKKFNNKLRLLKINKLKNKLSKQLNNNKQWRRKLLQKLSNNKFKLNNKLKVHKKSKQQRIKKYNL